MKFRLHKAAFSAAAILATIISVQAQNTFPATGNAGIGTTTPGTPLTIRTVSPFAMENTNGTVSIKTYLSSLLGQIGTYSNHPFQLMANNGINQFVLLPNGNVGIGQAAPAAKLDVNGDALINQLTAGRGAGNDTTNTVFGYRAMINKTSGYNIAIGTHALFANTNGFQNVAMGVDALSANTSGIENVAIGNSALLLNVSSSNNTAVGIDALYHSTKGDNTAVGSDALWDNTTGAGNASVGANALYFNSTGSSNVALGNSALMFHHSGDNNTAVGAGALFGDSVGYQNTVIGSESGASSNNFHNAMALGYSVVTNASNKVVVGNSSVTVIGGQVGWSTLSDGRFKKDIQQNVPGLLFINKLNPVTYHVELEKFEKFTGRKDSLLQAMKPELEKGEQKLRTGFIAQEVEAAAKELKYDFDGVNHPQTDKDNYSLVYAAFVPSLVKAVQELSRTSNDKEDEIATLKQQVADLQQAVADLRASAGHSSFTAANSRNAITTGTGDILLQNIPNPATSTTTIRYTLPSVYTDAQISITDSRGTVLKQLTISGSGNGNVLVATAGWAAGSYQYSLYIKGSLAASRQMVIVK